MDQSVEVQTSKPNNIELDDLKKTNQFACFELALAIQAGKQPPFGYDKMAEFYKKEEGTGSLPHSARAILVAEAKLAGKEEDLKHDFPSVIPATEFLVKHWEKTYPDLIKDITNRVSKPDYHFGGKK